MSIGLWLNDFWRNGSLWYYDKFGVCKDGVRIDGVNDYFYWNPNIVEFNSDLAHETF